MTGALRARHVGALLVAALCASCGGCESGQTPPPVGAVKSIATVAMLTGDVRVRARLSSAWETASAGLVLYPGDQLQAASGARAQVEFRSGSQLVVEPGSIVMIEAEPTAAAAIGRVDLRGGVVRGTLTASTTGGLAIGTPDGSSVLLRPVPGVGDVGYRVKLGEGGTVEVAVTRGRASLTTRDGRSELLERDQARDVRASAFVGDTVPLPDFPELLNPGIDATVIFSPGLEIEMSWSPVPTGSKYMVQVARDQSFLDLAAEAGTTDTRWRFAAPQPDTYFWRVAALNEAGREGEFGYARRLIVTSERAQDLLVAPPDNAIVVWHPHNHPSVKFSWRAVEPPTPYRIVIAKGSDLKRVVLSEEVHDQTFETQALEPGRYYWGVFAERGEARTRLFRAPRKLVVRRSVLELRVPKQLPWR